MSKSKKNVPYFGLLETEKGMDVTVDEGEKKLSQPKEFLETFE